MDARSVLVQPIKSIATSDEISPSPETRRNLKKLSSKLNLRKRGSGTDKSVTTTVTIITLLKKSVKDNEKIP